jgi:hypothetical protein
MNMKACLAICMGMLVVGTTVSADDLRGKYVGKTDCTQELRSAVGRYGIRLDSTQEVYLSAYPLKEAHILTIVQYGHGSCGVIRDIVQSQDADSSFVWQCVDPKSPADIVVGTWPAKHPTATGPAVEAWIIDLKHLKFAPLVRRVTCSAGNYAGSDEGDSLADWARKRALKSCTKQNAMQADQSIDHLSSWKHVYQAFKLFSQCDDGSIAEGYSDAVGKLLADNWNEFPDLARLATKDKPFQNFVLRHVDETIPAETLKKVAQNATNQCPTDAARFCKMIIAAASQ